MSSNLISSYALHKKNLPEIKWIIQDLIPEGLTVLAARPKTGKSFLALYIAACVATGRNAWDRYKTSNSQVLYLAYEDSIQSFKLRQTRMFNSLDIFEKEYPKNLQISTDYEQFVKGGMDAQFKELHDLGIQFVIIDTFARGVNYDIRGNGVYFKEYDLIAELKNSSAKHDINVMLIHHTRKGLSIDSIEAVLGTTGITGAADTIWVLGKEGSQVYLDMTGKNISSERLPLSFDGDTFLWSIIGNMEHTIASLTVEKKRILDFLKECNHPMKTGKIAMGLNKSVSTISELLGKLKNEGLIKNISYGWWMHHECEHQGLVSELEEQSPEDISLN